MCGIFTYINLKNKELENAFECLNRLYHRGPDSQELSKICKNVTMGFNRLAIVSETKDATSRGLIKDKFNSVYLNCNGEIYNWEFLTKKYKLEKNTKSDCEVILSLYIETKNPISPIFNKWFDVVNELDGVFAFTLHDRASNLVFACRDRFGVRPLFMKYEEDFIAFASEAKALCFENETTTNIHQFVPGNMWTIDLSSNEFEYYYKWYHLPKRITHIDYNTSKDIIKNLLVSAVGKRVSESNLSKDCNVGYLLSGGLDSSLIVALARFVKFGNCPTLKQQSKTIKTFSIGFRNSPDLINANIVAKYINSDHTEVIMEEKDIIDALPNVVRHLETYDTTTIRASVPMYLLCKYIKENTKTKVLLSGEGADELFGGYLYFHKAPNCIEFSKESRRLLSEIHLYDGLRSDRMTSAHSIELRVPFLDSDLVDFVSTLDSSHLVPWNTNREKRIEKAILRDAFASMEILPNEILYRQKEAFSDGVGNSSVKVLKTHCSEMVKTFNVSELLKHVNENCGCFSLPTTDEEVYYYKLYADSFGNDFGIMNRLNYWMPRWV